MKPKTVKFFIVLIILSFILSALYFFGSLLFFAINGQNNVNEVFKSLSDNIILFDKSYGINSNDFISNLSTYIKKNERISVIILENDNKPILALPASSTLIKIDTNSKFILSTKSPVIKILSTELTLTSNKKITLNAAIALIEPSKVFSLGRNAFMVIFIFTLLDLFILALLSLMNNNFTTQNKSNNKIDVKPLEDTSSIDQQPIENIDQQIIDTSPEETVISSQIVDVEQESPIQDSLESNSDIPQMTKKIDPLGLFSNTTGFGWESYFETRLDAELVRAASFEQELALIIIKFDKLNHSSPIYKKITPIILDFFHFRDLIFEYGEDGFAGIVLNMDIETGMTACETLYNVLNELLNQEDFNTKIGIGLSTRALRLIPGERLIKETKQATEKALNESSLPIVAFKVNQEKYKQYLVEETEKYVSNN